MAGRIQTFREFWPYYVREHSQAGCRLLHYIGSTLVLALLAASIVTGRGIYAAFMPVAGYGFAWVGHFFIEHNRPATFQYPLWSLAADWVMYGKMLIGRMPDEVRRATAQVQQA